MLAPHCLTTNRLTEPLSVHPQRLEFGWRVRGDLPQTGYELELHSPDGPVWASGHVPDTRPFGAPYGGPSLNARSPYSWRVRVTLDDGSTTPWSDPAPFETGILERADWRGEWITAPHDTPSDAITRYFRTTVTLPSPVVRGRAYASALGWYHLFVNQVDHTGSALVPRWTPFRSQVEYQAYDVTHSFQVGENVVGIVVSEGRYRGRNGFQSKPRLYGEHLAALAEVVLELADGSTVVVGTTTEWTVGRGRIRSADPKHGERADLRVGEFDWLDPHRPLEEENNAALLGEQNVELIGEEVERVAEVGRLRGAVSQPPSGVQLVDFGQNFSGVASVRLSGEAGRRIRLAYSEVVTAEGELDTAYMGAKDRNKWFQRDEVILGEEPTTYTPAMTIHGFRYLEIAGADPIDRGDVEGIVMSTQLTPISEFNASDPRLEKLWNNVVWSLRSNFTDTPTDCPTRERSGWTGDIQVFGPTAAQLVDCYAYLRRYLRNVATEQLPDGSIPPVIPAEGTALSHAVGWGDVAVLLPWTLYRYYGDQKILRDQYDTARRWVDHLAKLASTRGKLLNRLEHRHGANKKYIVDAGFHWGEWLRPGEGVWTTLARNILRTPAVVATAYLAHSARMVGDMAELLGKDDEAQSYRGLAANTAAAWRTAFVRRGGRRIGADKQDDYVRALAFDLLDADDRPRALERLVELIVGADYHLGTGFLSTPMLLSTLVDEGRPDLAYRILTQDSSPSWLGQVAKGATTVWETWEGYDDKGRARMSHNHYAFGSVARFLQERVAGLAPEEPGYRIIRFAPTIGGGLTSASVTVRTPYGPAGSAWTVEGTAAHLTLTIPPGCTGRIRVGGAERRLEHGRHQLTVQVDELG